MGDSKAGGPTGAVSQGSDEPVQGQKSLEQAFQDGVRAREGGTPACDNPYAVGSAERREWSAGWCATLKPEDEDDEPNSGYVKN